MKASLKLFASLAKHLPAEARKSNVLELEIEAGATVQEVIARLGLPPDQCSLVLLNGVFVAREDCAGKALTEGDVLAIWPPVAGG